MHADIYIFDISRSASRVCVAVAAILQRPSSSVTGNNIGPLFPFVKVRAQFGVPSNACCVIPFLQLRLRMCLFVAVLGSTAV